MKSIYKNLSGKAMVCLCCLFFASGIFSSCKKFIQVAAPYTSINASNVYSNDATAASVLSGVYAQMARELIPNAELSGISIQCAFSADDLSAILPSADANYYPYYTNSLTNANSFPWSSAYNFIFITNAAIEGLTASSSLTPAVKQQLIAEAKFFRAFCYFYAVNLFGDVPMPLSTDYKANALLPRTPKAQVYQQILKDLTEAQAALSPSYLKSDAFTPYTTSPERVRPTKWAAAALLARAYLFTGDYANAEAEATTVIGNPMFSLPALNSVFKMNSTETIWALQPVRTGTASNTGEGSFFILPATGPSGTVQPAFLSDTLLNSFEANDQRKTNWIASVTPILPGNVTYYYPFKYKIGAVPAPTQEYSMVLRLAEQYLIRAEARAQQGNISGSQADLNAVRARAGLPSTTAGDKGSLLAAIVHERQVELFTEWGDRWFTLKRTGTIDAVMTQAAPVKGGTWSSYKALYPIPVNELLTDPNLVQNTGY